MGNIELNNSCGGSLLSLTTVANLFVSGKMIGGRWVGGEIV
jgi:hypothetical protein